MTQDKSGMLWFATWNGLCRYDGYNFVTFKSKPGDNSEVNSDRVRDVVLGKDGNLYCKIETDYYRFNLKTYKYEKVNTKSLYSLPMIFKYIPREQYKSYAEGYEIQQVFSDHQHNTWLLGHYNLTKLVSTTPFGRLLGNVSNNTVRCMQKDAKGRIWICTKEDKQICILSSDGKFIGYLGKDGKLHSSPAAFAPVYAMTQSKDGTIWLGSKPEGLFRLRETASNSFSIEHINDNLSVYDLKYDRQNRLWIGTQGDGIFVCSNPTATNPSFFSFANKIKSFGIDALKTRRLLITNNGNMLATTTGGLLVFCNIYNSPSKIAINCHKREADRNNSLSNSATMNLMQLGNDYYISTETSGYNHLLTKDLTCKVFDFEHISESDGIGSGMINCIAPFGSDIVSVGMDNICLVNPKKHTTRNFNRHFLCMNLRFSDAEPIRLKNGNWLFSLEGGVVCIPEKSFHTKAYVPHIAISSVKVEDAAERFNCDANDTITLTSNERNLTISFAALDFSTEEPLLYQTRLGDQNWSSPTEDHTLNLYSLQPGTYSLQIRSTNAQGMWTDNVRIVTLIVEPHWYETIWAILLYLIIGIALVSGITYLIIYIRNINRQRRETLEAYLALLDTIENSAKDNNKHEANPLHGKVSNPEDDAFMAKLLQFTEQNISNDNASVDDMADFMAMSRSSLTRKMKSLIGIAPSEFLKEARLKHACQLLESTDKSISDIAYACGFSDPKYFTKCFKTSIGYSPKDYRLTE